MQGQEGEKGGGGKEEGEEGVGRSGAGVLVSPTSSTPGEDAPLFSIPGAEVRRGREGGKESESYQDYLIRTHMPLFNKNIPLIRTTLFPPICTFGP